MRYVPGNLLVGFRAGVNFLRVKKIIGSLSNSGVRLYEDKESPIDLLTKITAYRVIIPEGEEDLWIERLRSLFDEIIHVDKWWIYPKGYNLKGS